MIALFLNLAKTFDTLIVNHKILLQLLFNFGISNLGLKWFYIYQENRKQRVKINNVIGQETTIIEHGFSEGNVMNPILFILYINSVNNLKFDGLVFTYTDEW